MNECSEREILQRARTELVKKTKKKKKKKTKKKKKKKKSERNGMIKERAN